MIDCKGHRYEKEIILLCVRWYLAYPLRGYPAQDLLFKRSPTFWRQSGRRPNESSPSNSVPYKSSESESLESL